MEIDIRELVQIIRKRVWVIISFIVLAFFLSGIISMFFLDEIYESSTTLIVSKQSEGTKNDLQISDINLARNLVDTYSVIIKSNLVLESVLSDLNLNMTLGDLKSKIRVSAEGNTEIIRITVEDTVPERARDIANSLANVFIKEVNKLLKMENVQIIDIARTPGSPVRPRVLMNIAIAGMLGLMAGLGLVLLVEYLDNTIKTPEDVLKYTQLSVIGSIPDFNGESSKRKHTNRITRLISSPSMKAPVAEAYKTLRTNIQYSNLDNNLKVILVTSSVQSEGKTSTSTNLAISMAQSDLRVLLIDCDLRRSHIHRVFHILNVKGLTNVLAENLDYHQILNSVGIPNLDILTSGPKPPNPSEILGSARMEAFMKKVSAEFDVIILDAPPILPVADAMVLSKLADGVILVMEYGATTHETAMRAKESMEKVGAKILGAVINDIPVDAGGADYYYYYSDDGHENKSKLPELEKGYNANV
jgi:succinoglycan biosynthesis transport protein ExoP